jgi:hypothetical protein
VNNNWVTKYSCRTVPTTSSSARTTKQFIRRTLEIRVAHAESHQCWCSSGARTVIYSQVGTIGFPLSIFLDQK